MEDGIGARDGRDQLTHSKPIGALIVVPMMHKEREGPLLLRSIGCPGRDRQSRRQMIAGARGPAAWTVERSAGALSARKRIRGLAGGRLDRRPVRAWFAGPCIRCEGRKRKDRVVGAGCDGASFRDEQDGADGQGELGPAPSNVRDGTYHANVRANGENPKHYHCIASPSGLQIHFLKCPPACAEGAKAERFCSTY